MARINLKKKQKKQKKSLKAEMGCGFSAAATPPAVPETVPSSTLPGGNVDQAGVTKEMQKSGPDALSSAHQPSAPNSTTREPSVTTATVLIASEVIGTLSMDGGVVSGFLL